MDYVLNTGGLKDGFTKPKLVAQLYHSYANYKRVVSDEKYNILFVNINTTGCPISQKQSKLTTLCDSQTK